jgi:TATA-binding protein-associated factor Taf7
MATPNRILQDQVAELEADIAKKEREHGKSIDDLLMRHQKEVECLKKELRDRQR